MSDTSTQTGTEGTAEAGAQQQTTQTDQGTQQTPEALAAAQGAQEQQETFSREYVEELRRENAKYRTKANEFEAAFEGYDPDSRAALLDITKQLADPSTQPAAAKRLQAIAAKIMEGAEKGTPRRPDGEEDPDQRPMTRAEWKAEQQRLREEDAQAAAIRDIEDTARKLEVEPGSPDYALLLLFAQEPEVAGDLTKAKARLDEHYAAKAKARAEALVAKGEKWPGAPGTAAGDAGGTGAADIEGGKGKTWKEGRAGALAYLRAKAGATQ